MAKVTDVPLNDDESDATVKPRPGAKPMVVVQYRQRGVPWWLLALLIFVVPLCMMFVYDSMFMGRDRAQIAEATEAVKSLVKSAATPEVKKKPETSEPLALNSQPIPAPAGPAKTAAAAAPDSADVSASRDSSADSGSNGSAVVAGKSAPADPSGQAPRAPSVAKQASSDGGQQSPAAASTPTPTTAIVALGPGSPPPVAGDRGTEVAGAGGPAPSPANSGADSSHPDSRVVANAANDANERSGRPADDRRSPFDDPGEQTTGVKPSGSGGANPPDPFAELEAEKRDDHVASAKPSGPGNPEALPRLPTKEESEAEFRKEAAENAEHIREQYENKAAELQSARYQERVRFREELGAILQEFKNAAGPEIDKLMHRQDSDKDPERWRQADLLWQRSRLTQAAKIKLVRGLDLPESEIFALLFDDFNRQVRTRSGPRNSNEVRIWAAQKLLATALPPADAMPQSRQSAGAGPGRTSHYNAVPSPDRPVQRHR
jgi:hypothetical protein